MIRIARSEMGQGTFTALAQLVAEELDCDWAKVSAEFASPNEHIRRNRDLGLDVHRRQPGRALLAGLRAQGRRQRPRDADRRGGAALAGAGGRVCRRQEPGHPQADGPDVPLWRTGGRSGEDRAAQGREAARPEGLEDRRQIRASAGHPRQGARQAGVRRGRGAARHAARLDRAVPGVRRQAGEGGCEGSAGHARREEGGAAGRFRRRDCRQLVARRPGAAEAGHRLGRSRQRQGRQRADRRHAARGPQRQRPAEGARHGQRQHGVRRCRQGRQGDRGRVFLALPQPRHPGADDLHGVVQGRRHAGGVDIDAERRGGDAGGGSHLRPAAGQGSRCTR